MTDQDFGTRTLTIPVFRVKGDGQLSSGATINQLSVVDAYPSKEVTASDTVVITIESRYYRGWGQFFLDEFDISESQVSYTPSNNQVRVSVGAGEELFVHLRVYTFTFDEPS
jgi:hypothetical protein